MAWLDRRGTPDYNWGMSTLIQVNCVYRCPGAIFDIDRESLAELGLEVRHEKGLKILARVGGNPILLACVHHLTTPITHPVTGRLARPHPDEPTRLMELDDVPAGLRARQPVAI